MPNKFLFLGGGEEDKKSKILIDFLKVLLECSVVSLAIASDNGCTAQYLRKTQQNRKLFPKVENKNDFSMFTNWESPVECPAQFIRNFAINTFYTGTSFVLCDARLLIHKTIRKKIKKFNSFLSIPEKHCLKFSSHCETFFLRFVFLTESLYGGSLWNYWHLLGVLDTGRSKKILLIVKIKKEYWTGRKREKVGQLCPRTETGGGGKGLGYGRQLGPTDTHINQAINDCIIT